MYVLGITSFGHDSAAALLHDGHLVCAVEEERFARKKHTGEFPARAIQACLAAARIRPDQVDAVGFYWNPWAQIARRGMHLVRYFPDSLALLSLKLNTVSSRWSVPGRIRDFLGKPSLPVHMVEHHLAHAASAFHVSPFDEAAILSIDGTGEWTTTLYAHGRGNDIRKLKEIYFPNTLGDLYTAVCVYLGFMPCSGEGKVMGLAAYGDPNPWYEPMREMVRLKGDGDYVLDTRNFLFHVKGEQEWYSPRMVQIFGPPRPPEAPIEKRHEDIAAALQRVLEECVMDLVGYLKRATGSDRLCLAGGVALNSVMNGRILREGPFREVSVQPAANDAGASLGAALYVYHCIHGGARGYVLDSAQLGPEHSEEEMRQAAGASGLPVQEMPVEDLVPHAAEALAQGKIIGWFRGRAEFGPRALGARSILADPRRKEMKDILNFRVKHREPFRPFAPAIPLERCADYFERDYPSPFMLLVYNVLTHRRDEVPSITHVDGTARVQTVDKRIDPVFHSLVEEFGRKTGTPVLLNTSFNVRGEPIVNSPEQAVSCFLGTDLDALALGNRWIEKPPGFKPLPTAKRELD